MYTHHQQISIGGAPAANAKGALIMLHGRGASASDMMQLAGQLNTKEMTIYAPQATNSSWYPYSFLAPVQENEPALSSAIALIDEVVAKALADDFTADKIYFAGFSQGACLTLEYITRNAKQYGGAVAFTGGLIGEEINLGNYKGDFAGTPVLITTGDPDPHVPVSRVEESVAILQGMNADVTLKVYKGRPHTITHNEIVLANQHVFV
ncbi:alpha/beta hydrolase [Mucilaginibacter phyllosphaerae]|uniref:Phospholipase n=1 Tax=Mucilaginibacter phyllosphaerae TaxID=1812349 RepID=A0A4Y8AJP0_9SPHI|nr:dienelactone hydrolase family protein [Mucilaginibacter phyllosphaerae]MBB3968130.1 phospholipase/carboxylesterase [Mucilaginibacter phyllosphaerae]TEW68852.1 phospholipase [Mucilaginibacter phyllosphaerae]GGH01050.1 phospholipase/carboxylesterase [Mucilaginibacter phyllosphaerae]